MLAHGPRDFGLQLKAPFRRPRELRQLVDVTNLGTEVDMSKTIIKTGQAPAAVGPYSQGVVLDGWIWTCGQVALDPATVFGWCVD